MATLPEVPPLGEVSTGRYPYNIAVVVNGTVYSVVNVPGQQAAMYLSQPEFIHVDIGTVTTGYTYDSVTGEFAPPALLPEEG